MEVVLTRFATDTELYFVDNVIQHRRGTPLVVAALYTSVLSRMGVAAQVLTVPNTQQVLIVGASSRGAGGEKRCFVIDVASQGRFRNVPIEQLETTLDTTLEARMGKEHRNTTAKNLLRSVDLCIHVAKRLVFTLAHKDAHRAESSNEEEEEMRASYLNLIVDLTGAVESGADVFKVHV